MSFKNILLIAFCLSTYLGFSQQEIKLVDTETNLPITRVFFKYGDQKGLSNDNGVFHFEYTKGLSIALSHINYGSWTLTDEEVQKAIQEKNHYRKKETICLYPVTVIAVKPQQQSDNQVQIDYQEGMEHDAAAILNKVPAFNSIRKSGNYGFDPVFRGFKYDQLNIVLNGAQSATAACPNRMDPPTSQMAPNMMDRIEILKGPHALRFGTGFGATINFIPAKLRFTDKATVYGRVSSGYENNGTITRGEAQIGLSSKVYDFRLFGSWSKGDDYKTGDDTVIPASFARNSFGANLGVKLTDKQQLRVSATYNSARNVDFPALAMDLRKDDTWMFNTQHTIQINSNTLQTWNTTLYGSFVNHFMDNLSKDLSPRMLNATTPAKTYNYGGRTEGTWLFKNGKLFSGADFRIENAKGTRSREFLMGPNKGKTIEDNAWQNGQITKSALFAEYHLKTTAFNYIFSGRLELNNANIKDPEKEFTQVHPNTNINQLNPNMSFSMLKDFGKQINTSISLGRAQRSGGLTERFINYFPVGQDPYEMLGNPELKPEINNQIDLTFKWANNKTAINIDLYASYLQDYISSIIDPSLTARLPKSPGVRQFINIDEALKTGFEISWTQRLLKGLQHQFGVAYTKGEDLNSKQALPEIAPLDLRYTLLGSYVKNKLKPEITFRHVMKQANIAKEFGETTTPPFSLLNVKISYAVTKKLNISGGANNVLNKNYYEHLSRSVGNATSTLNAPGRNLFTNISFVF